MVHGIAAQQWPDCPTEKRLTQIVRHQVTVPPTNSAVGTSHVSESGKKLLQTKHVYYYVKIANYAALDTVAISRKPAHNALAQPHRIALVDALHRQTA